MSPSLLSLLHIYSRELAVELQAREYLEANARICRLPAAMSEWRETADRLDKWGLWGLTPAFAARQRHRVRQLRAEAAAHRAVAQLVGAHLAAVQVSRDKVK